MKSDRKIKQFMTKLQCEVNDWHIIEKSCGNQNAYTDRMLENCIDICKQIEKLYEKKT